MVLVHNLGTKIIMSGFPSLKDLLANSFLPPALAPLWPLSTAPIIQILPTSSTLHSALKQLPRNHLSPPLRFLTALPLHVRLQALIPLSPSFLQIEAQEASTRFTMQQSSDTLLSITSLSHQYLPDISSVSALLHADINRKYETPSASYWSFSTSHSVRVR